MSADRDITTMNVSLPRAQKDFVDQQVKRGSFFTVSDYICYLIRREQLELVPCPGGQLVFFKAGHLGVVRLPVAPSDVGIDGAASLVVVGVV